MVLEDSALQEKRHQDSPLRKEMHVRKMLFLGVALVFIVSLSAGFAGGWLGAQKSRGFVSLNQAQKEVVLSEGQLISNIAKTVGQSVVSINVTSQVSAQRNSFFGFVEPEVQQSAGTGIILSADGVIITNRHVVPASTTNVVVTLADGTEFKNVQVLGRTSPTDALDIAFLKIRDTKGKKLMPAKLGNSTKVQVGDRVVAIGNALGQFQNTVTSGIISGHGRQVVAGSQNDVMSSESLEDLFQTDAAINGGNSGGPLVNIEGEVIGINTAVAGDAQNIGFSIPISNVSGFIKTVLATGKFQQPYLGVRYLSLNEEVAKQFDLKITKGAYIVPAEKNGDNQGGVIKGSPADKAGLKEGDIITGVNGTALDVNHSLTALLDQSSVGDTVSLGILRDGKHLTVQAKLELAPNRQ